MASKAGGEPNAGGMKDGRGSQMGRRHDGETTGMPNPETVNGETPSFNGPTPAAKELAKAKWIQPKKDA